MISKKIDIFVNTKIRMGIIIKTKSGKIGHVVAINSPYYMCHELDENYEFKKRPFAIGQNENVPLKFATKIVDAEKIGFLDPWKQSATLSGEKISLASLILSKKID